MSMAFKKFPNKILVHMKTFDKTNVRVLDQFIGRGKLLSYFFSKQSLTHFILAFKRESIFINKSVAFYSSVLQLHNDKRYELSCCHSISR